MCVIQNYKRSQQNTTACSHSKVQTCANSVRVRKTIKHGFTSAGLLQDAGLTDFSADANDDEKSCTQRVQSIIPHLMLELFTAADSHMLL